MGSNAPTVCQDGARDFFKIDEKIGGEGVVANLKSNGGRGQKFSLMPLHFCSPGHAHVCTSMSLSISYTEQKNN